MSAPDPGRPVCTDLSCRRVPGGAAISGTVLREVPVGSRIREATKRAAEYGFSGAGPFYWVDTAGNRYQAPTMTGDGLHHYLDSKLTEDPELHKTLVRPARSAAREGVRVTDERPAEVSRIYREAVPMGKPTQEVAARLFVARSTAGRLVMRARQAGLLGAANGTTGGEAPKKSG